MCKLALFICCLTALLQPFTLTTQSQTGRGGDVRVCDTRGQTYNLQLYKNSYALLIGNSEYTNWKDLPGVRQDINFTC